jgi:hypothetical protein
MDAMNDDDGSSPHGRPGRPTLRAGALAAAVTVVTLLAAACGGSSAAANTFAPGATHAQSLAFAKCMRANGVPGFPDPTARESSTTPRSRLSPAVLREMPPYTSAGQCSRTRAPG